MSTVGPERLGLVIDSHVHIGTGDGLHGPWDTQASLPLYLARARPAGIRGAVVMAPLTSDYPRANAEVARIIRSRPGFIGYLFVNARTEAGRVGERVADAVGAGFCGIKVHAHDAPITREVAEAARRWQLPVLYDARGDTASVEMVTRSYPDVAWIVPHLSSFADDWKAQCAFVDQLVRVPNLFTDTSGVRYYDLLDDAVRRAGPTKVLFGSDGPFLHPGVELAKALALPLDRTGREAVLSGNVLRLTAPARLRFRDRRRLRRTPPLRRRAHP